MTRRWKLVFCIACGWAGAQWPMADYTLRCAHRIAPRTPPLRSQIIWVELSPWLW